MAFSSERTVLLTEAILDSLSLPAFRDRELQIVTSYESTFEWIWQQSHPISQWLAGDHGTSFWITGLPGSGKSTLLRYIVSSPRTRSALKQWTGGKNVLLASFYFWESGTAMQRSHEGLLRSLLHQLLLPHPEMIPLVFPTLWADLWDASAVERVRRLARWNLLDLGRGFQSFFIEAPSRPICLLVDGLDEFEGDHQIAIDLLKGISETGKVKLCISSRPWDVFEEAFRNVPKLALQDLTRGDMMQYTSGQLGRLGLVEGNEKEFDGLIHYIVDKSEGVFLWASQVVKWLLKSKVVTITEAAKKVEDLPSGLNNLYRHQLVDTATEETLSIVSKIVQVMQARESVCRFTRDEASALVTVWEMVFATRFSVDEVLELQIQQVPPDMMKEWCHSMVDDIKVSTDGLVEVQSETQGEDTERVGQRSISYIHRTVKDFFSGTTWSSVRTSSSLSPHIGLLQSALLVWKYPTTRPRRARAASAWWPTIALAFSHARHAPLADQDAAFDLLIDMNATLNWYYIGTSESPGEDSWARSCFGTLEQRGRILYEDPFLGLAVKFGLEQFVIHYVKEGLYIPGEGRSLLEWATLYLFDRQSSIYPLSSPTIVATLLDAGADPNYRLTYRKNSGDAIKTVSLTSPWGLALEALQQGFRRHWISKNPIDIERWTCILRLFLEHGADTDLVAQATYKDPKEGARVLLQNAYTTFPCAETESLWDLAR